MPLPYKAIGSTRRRAEPVDRLAIPIPTAVEVAATIMMMKNLIEAAALIDQYADAKAAEQRLEAVAAGARP
jgi:hypothetical protein